MTATRDQKKELILYVLQTFLDVTEEKPIYLALVKEGLEEINDLLLFRDEDVPMFKYMHKVDDNTEEEQSLVYFDQRKLMLFIAWVCYQQSQNNGAMYTNEQWTGEL
jgi:hypothetical protein